MIALYITMGLGIGLISGPLGIGGGVFLVPLLMAFCEFDAKKATGTSLAVLGSGAALPAALHAFKQKQVDLEAAVWIAGAAMVGAYVGRQLLDYMPDRGVRMLFGFMMLYIALRFILGFDTEAANAAAGLVGVALAWLLFLGMRAVGRKYMPPPLTLTKEIQVMREKEALEEDYHI